VAKEIGARLGWSAERINDEVRRFAVQRTAELETVRSSAIRGAA